MKKILALILSVLLIFACVTGCGDKDKDPTPAPDPTPEKSGPDLGKFWEAMEGVWTAQDSDGTYLFIIFGYFEDGNPGYTSGIMASGAVRGGNPTGLEEIKENEYKLTVDYPAVPETEESSGMDAVVKDYTMKIDPDNGTFTIDDLFVIGTDIAYTYAAPTMEEAYDILFK